MKIQKGKVRKRIGHGFGSAVSISAVGLLLVLFLPWMVYQQGAGAAWIAIGAFGGVLLVWQLLSYRLMRFALQQEGTVTLPGFFSRRYREKNPVVRVIFALILAFTLLLFAVAVLRGTGSIAGAVFGIRREITEAVLLVISVLLLLFTKRGALRPADRWIAILTMASLVAIIFSVLRFLGGEGVLKNIFHSWASGSVSVYVDVEYLSGEQIGVTDHISMLTYGLLIAGSPLVLQRLQQGENGKTVHTSRRWAILFSLISLFLAVFAGGMFRGALYPAKIETPEEFFGQIAHEVTTSGFVFYSACIMFLVTAGLVFFDLIYSSIVQAVQILQDDLFGVFRKMIRGRRKKKEKDVVQKDHSREYISLITGMILGAGILYAEDDIYRILLEVLIIVACGLFPVTLLSLYSGRMNLTGTVIGFFGGAAAAVFWELIPLFTLKGEMVPLRDFAGFHGTLPCMALGLLIAWIAAILSRKPDEEIVKDYEAVKYRYVTDDDPVLPSR